MTDSIKIVLADDQNLFREGLKRILAQERDFLVTAEAARSEEVGPAVAEGNADVLLLDLKLPGRGTVQTLLQLKEDHPDNKTMILTASGDRESILNAAKAGARGYMLKDETPETLLQAIRTIHVGGVWIDQDLPGATDFAVIASHTGVEPPREDGDRLQSLTKRELEVLKLLAEGLSNDEIAARTFISERTVKAHVSSIFAKLKVDNRVKAALAILRRGVPSPPPPASPSPRRPGGSARGR
ncbi:MAG: response regulator transcription factor [Deltaproteobacteria bacterium]|nr:response regulator transcription factor [Deltaproteobacteria bacterium]